MGLRLTPFGPGKGSKSAKGFRQSGGLNKFLDPLGLFGEASSESEQMLDPETIAFLRQFREREPGLYDQMMGIIEGEVPATADQAYEAEVGELDRLYPELSRDIAEFRLAPEAQTFLDNLRDERISGLKTSVQDLIGSEMADLAGRGVTSSSTAEGSMGAVGRQIAPYVSKAHEDYWLQRLQLPGQHARERYDFASGFGGLKGDALRRRLETRLSPISQVWSQTANLGATPWGQKTTGTSDEPIGTSLLSMVGSYLGKKK